MHPATRKVGFLVWLLFALSLHADLSVNQLCGFGARKPSGSVGPTAPNTVSGLTNWFAADAITGKVDGDSISSWTDASASPHNLIQATSGNQPIYKTAIQNSLPCVRFSNATSTNMVASGSATIQHTFLVAKVRAANFGSYGGALGTNGSVVFTGDFFSTSWLDGSGGYWPSSSIYYLDSTIQSGSSPAGNTTTHIYELQFGSSITDTLTAGMDRAFTSRCLDVDIFEIVTYNRALSSGERVGVYLWLKNKWGL